MDNTSKILATDRRHLWHPYSAMYGDEPLYAVKSTAGVYIRLQDGRRLIDGMASWWSAIHGYNHPAINLAIDAQLHDMAHIMFGGLTHQPAVDLAKLLVDITPPPLQTVFFADSGSVAVEVAMKMAVQYWQGKGEDRHKMLAFRCGYHGDTFGAMSVSDPVGGMHGMFAGNINSQIFAEAPAVPFGENCSQSDLAEITKIFAQNKLAAVIIEPIAQGAGGMRFYSADYLRHLRHLCDQYGVLLIFDEIATGFGRTGKLFASEWAGVAPDILCVGKALTGGYMSLAATLSTVAVAETIGAKGTPFMHGPTFMANPLACSTALASVRLLLDSDWQGRIANIQQWLQSGLAPCQQLPAVKQVRVLGAIGVVELHDCPDFASIQRQFVELGVWVRPFAKLIYIMPAYIISDYELAMLTAAITKVVADI